MHRYVASMLAAVFLALIALADGVEAAEQILSYDVTVDVRPDGGLDVEERIRVNAEGNQIRRGIYRDFPVVYRSDSGYVRRVGFTVTAIMRDGRDEPWHSESTTPSSNGEPLAAGTEMVISRTRIYIGDKDVFVSSGVHDYVLRYRTTRQLRYFVDHDEIYWNATGNFWTFPIASASARINLPAAARILSMAAYTGPFGAKGQDWRIASQSDTSITFETTRTLEREEGLTVAVGFPKGIVPEPGALARQLQSLWDNLGFAALIAAIVATGLYFWRTWLKIGRDPDKGTIIPLFAPPGRMSPGVVSYIFYQGFPSIRSGAPRAFIAALMDMAVKGAVNIVDEDGDIEIRSLAGSKAALSSGEAVIAARLFKGRDRVAFTKANGPMLQDAVSRFKAGIGKENAGVFFRNNYGAFAWGAGLSVAALIAFFVLQLPTADQVGMIIFSLVASTLGALLVSAGGRRLMGWVPGGSSKLLGIVLVLPGIVVLVVVLGSLLVPDNPLPVLAQASAICLGLMNVSFYHLLRAPTHEGRKAMDRIEGFKLYLSVAEEGRFNINEAPQMSEQLFERFLPYAIALGVEKPWTRAFQKWLAVARPEAAGQGYAPGWYSGRGFDAGSLDRATAGMVAGISAGMAAAMPSQSSSGSSGGGSSGGGGGGGGGGGW